MYGFVVGMILCSYVYRKSNSKMSPASGAGNVSEPGLMSHWGSAQSHVCMVSVFLQLEQWKCQ